MNFTVSVMLPVEHFFATYSTSSQHSQIIPVPLTLNLSAITTGDLQEDVFVYSVL